MDFSRNAMKNNQVIHKTHVSGDSSQLDFFRQEQWSLPYKEEWPLYPYCMEEVVRSSHIRFREELCPYMIAVYLLEGEIIYECGEGKFRLQPGMLLLIPKGATYSFESSPENSFYHKLVLEIKGANLSSLAESLNLNSLHYAQADIQIAEDIRFIGDLMQKRNEGTIAELLGKTYEFLCRVSFSRQPTDEDSALLMKAQAKLESNLKDNVSIPKLARELGTTAQWINMLFKERLNMPPLHYRIICRIEQAQYLLSNTSLSIKEIAFRLGYCNQFYFSREFSRMTGTSPRSFRKHDG